MDRKGQLRNVAFGGAWSEQIEGNETLARAMRTVEAAESLTRHEDLRKNRGMVEAVDIVTSAHPKGALLSAAWIRALNILNAGVRSRELTRIAATLREGLGERAGPKGG